MSCCGGNCNCGSNCSCGSGCGKMYPDMEKATTVTIIEGVAPKKINFDESAEKSYGAEGVHGCNYGPNCKCDPCTAEFKASQSPRKAAVLDLL